jgi:NAD+ kinase
MKAILFGKESAEIKDLVIEKGIEIVSDNPDIVISYGGDGTLIMSEALYPAIPKVILRNSAVCKLCSNLENETILDNLISKKYSVKEIEKLEVSVGKEKMLAINDTIIHNKNPRHAIRYKVVIDGKEIPPREVIGDGLIIATPFGSSGYYRSITDGIFNVGIGIAFNNSTEQSDHMVIRSDSIIKIIITRGPALIFADNQEKEIEVKTGDEITIKKSNNLAKILNF